MNRHTGAGINRSEAQFYQSSLGSFPGDSFSYTTLVAYDTELFDATLDDLSTDVFVENDAAV